MPRLTTKLFTDLAVWMLGLGLLVGLSFPFFAAQLGIDTRQVFSPAFWVATITAGLVAGTLNFVIARLVVRPRLALLAQQTRRVEQAIRGATYTGDWSSCTVESCRVPVDSQDEIGDSATAFNDLVDALFRAHEIESAVSDFSTTLSRHLAIDSLSHTALEHLLLHTRALAGAVLVELSGELRVTAHHALHDPERLTRSSHVLYALQGDRLCKVPIHEEVRIEALLADFRPAEVLAVPVSFKGRALGVVVLASDRPFTSDAEWLLQLFSQGFGLALNNAVAHDQLQRLAAVDPLTGAYNRRFGLVRIREELNRALREQSQLGIVMIDVDHFKLINDSHGHLFGDRVLARLVELLRQELREGDILVRYGGEEFLLALPGAGLDESRQLAERLRVLVAESFIGSGEEVLQITISVGVSAYPDHGSEEVNALIQQADEALYGAKDGGRNQVVLASLA